MARQKRYDARTLLLIQEMAREGKKLNIIARKIRISTNALHIKLGRLAKENPDVWGDISKEYSKQYYQSHKKQFKADNSRNGFLTDAVILICSHGIYTPADISRI